MLNWIKNLFVGTPAPTSTIDTKVEAANAVPYKVETPAIVPVTEASVVITAPAAIAPAAVVAKPKAPAKPKTAVVKKAVSTTASKKPATRGRKPKAGV